MQINVGIGFVTGRKHFQNVLRSYINNWVEQGLIKDENIRFHLFVAYDLKYHKTQVEDYKNIPPQLAKMVDSINFYGSTVVAAERESLLENNVLSKEETELIFGEGYARKRNIVSYFAMKQKMDRLIFIDDDEYPVAVLKNEYGRLVWMGQSVVGTHLKNITEADITHGHHCGYISPIPYLTFNETLTENDFKLFIEAISNDIVSWDKIKKLIDEHQGVTYANDEIVNKSTVYEVKEESAMKFISGANLCFNLKSVKNLPSFYNPPGARGEDAFMSTLLSSLKVVKVPCYTFHDGFMMYNHLLNGVLPTTLEGVEGNTPAVIKRFTAATIGWIRYKPLLVYITQPNEYEQSMKDIEAKLVITIPKLCKYFQTTEFEEILKEFRHYTRNVKKHYREFIDTQNAWSKAILSLTSEN